MSDRINIARDAILDELRKRYVDGDRTVRPLDPDDEHHWYKPQKNYFSGKGVILCPVCKTGTLLYSRSSYNGHVRGECTTVGCVWWRE